MATNPPKPGNRIIQSLINEKAIIMAANTRVVPGVVRGILRAAKDLKAPIIFELARSECNLEGGYTGHTPESYAKAVMSIADEIGWPYWALHADHITLKKGDADDIASTKKLIKGQIDAGFTSFAIDASYLFDHSGKTTREELAKALEMSPEQYDSLRDEALIRKVISSSLPVGPESSTTIEEQVAAKGPDLEDLWVEYEVKQEIVDAIRLLPRKERMAVNLYYLKGLTLREIGNTLGVTESRACQLRSQGVKRMKVKLKLDP